MDSFKLNLINFKSLSCASQVLPRFQCVAMGRRWKTLLGLNWYIYYYIYCFLIFSFVFCVLLSFLETVDQYLLDKTLPAILEDRLWTLFRRTHSAQSCRSCVYKSAHRCRYSRTRHKLLGTHRWALTEPSLSVSSPTGKGELVCLVQRLVRFY